MLRQSFQKFRDNFDPISPVVTRGAFYLATAAFIAIIAVGEKRHWSLTQEVVIALLVAASIYFLILGIRTLARLPHLESKPRSLDPIQRQKMSDYLKQFPNRTVSVVITEEAMRDDGASFAKDIESAIAEAAWEVHRGEPADETDPLSRARTEENKFNYGLWVYGAGVDPSAKTILQDAFRKVGVAITVETAITYEAELIIVVGLRD